jgi:hypothetical protein
MIPAGPPALQPAGNLLFACGLSLPPQAAVVVRYILYIYLLKNPARRTILIFNV